MTRTGEILYELDARHYEIIGEKRKLDKLLRQVGGDVVEQVQAVDEAWHQLAATLCDRLDATLLDTLAHALHLPTLMARQVAERRQATLAQAAARRRAMLNDDRVKNSEGLLNEADIRLHELKETIEPLAQSIAMLDDAPLFQELLAHRYGTAEYGIRFWQLSYYKHWKHADLIVEVHGVRLGKADFRGIAEKYIAEREAMLGLENERSSWRQKAVEVRRLLAELREAEQTIATIDEVTLKATQAKLVEHLKPLGRDTLSTMLRPFPAAHTAMLRITGIEKKGEYLGALENQQIRTALRELGQQEQKLMRTRAKLLRPKNANRRWDSNEARRMVGQSRRERWDKRHQRWSETRTQIVQFNDYHHYNPAADLLWWDVMTDGRLDGDFIPEVHARGPRTDVHHHHHHHHERERDSWRDSQTFDAS